ncbi:MAG: putative porin [Bacteroidales bacterium]|nr:putative porin [Bacteroidales bacterium]
MRRGLTKILVPVVVIGLAAIQSFGVDAGRAIHFNSERAEARRLGLDRPDTSDYIPAAAGDSLVKVTPDSTELARLDSLKHLRWLRDSVIIDSLKAQIDSFGLDWMDSSDLVLLDSLQALWAEPEFNPADTVRIPDSLEFKDPFKFKYYVALKDTATRRHVRDSLIAALDTLELERFDSLYFKDSSEVAAWRWQLKWESMSKSERKKWKYEQELPGKIHRMDSIQRRKDSIKARKDSIRENTPRILETSYMPDSLQYLRLVMWKHERYVNDIKRVPYDTTYNNWFYDYRMFKEDLNATWLGISGSPTQKNNFFKRDHEENVGFYSAYLPWSYTPENLTQYNTKTPYTELAYWGTILNGVQTEESNIKILTTQNITPALNLCLEYSRFGANGILQNEKTNNRTAVVGLNYLGKNYLMHGGYIHNRIERTENGGAIDTDPATGINWFRDTTVKDAREVSIRLSEASNHTKRNTYFLDQSYRFPMEFFKKLGHLKEIKEEKLYRDSLMNSGDTLAIKEYLDWEAAVQAEADSLDKDVTSAFVGHSTEYSVFSKYYKDNITNAAGREFYNNNFFLHPSKSADSMRVMRLENRIYLRLQPWKSDAVLSKIDVGVGDKLLSYYNFNNKSYLGGKSTVWQNSLYAYAGAQGQYKKYLHWDANGRYTFAGAELNDFNINADVDLNFFPFHRDRNSPLSLSARFETDLKEADWYQKHMYSNHYRWDNDFKKISTTKVTAELDVPRIGLKADFGYALIGNHVFYDTLGLAKQAATPVSVISAGLTENFQIWKFHFDNSVQIQYSSDQDVLPLPLVTARLRWYAQFDIVKNVMQWQVGLNVWYNTLWYAQAWNPALGTFQNQKEIKIGNAPYADAFINIQWKRACLFLKVMNVNEGWPAKKHDYFSAPHYIRTTRTFKFGIYWPFYVSPSSKGNSSVNTGGTPRGHLTAGH